MGEHDLHEASQLNELKVNMSMLNMVAGWHMAGDPILIEQMPIMGGYAGGVEETAVVDVATSIASFTIFNADIHLDGPIHVRWGCTSARESLKVAAWAASALDANTDLLLANQYYTVAGPCTEMCLLEVAAQAIVDTASGRELLSGVAAAKGVLQDKTSGMEARIMGETSAAVCGMEIDYVNELLENLLSHYEPYYASAPSGKTFQQCYNVAEVVPTDEYLDIYEKAQTIISSCGLDF